MKSMIKVQSSFLFKKNFITFHSFTLNFILLYKKQSNYNFLFHLWDFLHFLFFKSDYMLSLSSLFINMKSLSSKSFSDWAGSSNDDFASTKICQSGPTMVPFRTHLTFFTILVCILGKTTSSAPTSLPSLWIKRSPSSPLAEAAAHLPIQPESPLLSSPSSPNFFFYL